MHARGRLALTCAAVCSAALLPQVHCRAQTAKGREGEKRYLRASPDDMRWWRAAKFGLFVHWGPVSLTGKEIGWSRGGERRGHRTQRNPSGTPVEVYDSLYKRFNPVKFNAEEWVAIAKAAGMKYLVFTTKHHDGFCMFDTRLTDYKITNSPFNRDVAAELAQACHEGGIRLGFYYSPADWHHPDYRTENHSRYIEYMH
ncbi:MAG: alpha-L-fucosidase, partial [Armatimonadota bacterium]